MNNKLFISLIDESNSNHETYTTGGSGTASQKRKGSSAIFVSQFPQDVQERTRPMPDRASSFQK